MVTRARLSSVAVLCAALFSAQAAQAQSGPANYQPRRADVVAAAPGRPLALAGSGAPERTVVDLLRARGRQDATLATVHLVDTRGGRAGARHLRFEQTVDGLPVYGAYAKAAFDRSGAMVNLIDQLAPVPTAALAPARIGADQALRAALARLHPDASADLRVAAARGTTTTFVGGAFFHESPTVTAVAVPLSDGSMTRGWLVETWTQRSNLLHHTLVGGDGSILHVEKRTANDSYNIFPVSPAKGPQAVVPGPGVAGNAQSPVGWLSVSAAQTNVNIVGNNVHAYLDTDHNNRADGGGTPVATGDFLAMANLAQSPTTATNKAVSVQNLFYLNNVIHDILYSHGFNEAAGNFQADNFGNGGAGRDAVNAEGQDGGGTDNANFATPPDGRKPRMQMFLFTGAGPTHEVVITSPKSATYGAKGAEFGAPLDTTGLTGAIAAGPPTDGCTAMSGVNGKIALVDRGNCDFTAKALNAQRAGATGLIVANNTGGTTTGTMGGTNRKVTIPAVMISQNDGAALRKLAAPVGTMRLKAVQPLQIDGGLDSDVVFHEYGHGLTWRMIGGMSGPLAGAIGEGASDGVAMLVNGDDSMGEYASSSAAGIRRNLYSGYSRTYSAVTGAEVHDDGEIYAAVVWRLIELFGPARRSELFTYYVDAMNYIPQTPSYEQMRDGMLQAVANGPVPADACTVWAAFAQFGIGVGASGVVNADGTVTIVESFAKGGGC